MTADIQLEDGKPWPLGAHWDGHGVNFALFSAHAERVELCVYWPQDAAKKGGEHYTLPMPRYTDEVWHGYLPDASPGLRYAFRVYGKTAAEHRFDPSKLLLDPYAREVANNGAPQTPAARSALQAPPFWASVVDDAFDWGNDAPPHTPWADSVLYEVHVKGATQQHPELPEILRGTYAGLATPTMLKHFQDLGVTALNLLPVHAFLDEARLVQHGLTNYWGYNTLAFFAPEPRYAARLAGQSVLDEFRSMVRALHASKIEVILDVVFNHSAESDQNGPTLSFRGIDNASYYRLNAEDRRLYENFSGCGNTLNLAHPRVLQLVLDSLRYWVSEMHVDGFRFDLAAALTRDSAFLAAVAQDPILARVKLIAEPWDLGPGGYQLGHFSLGWSEWNDRFRDDIRAFWLTGEVGVGALAQRLCGSSEIFRHRGRTPQAGLNFICAHDGFTLRDLVSYQQKHNEQNGENNRDGHGHNLSCHFGAEGETQDAAILKLRAQHKRALLSTLLIAQGVPMLQGGDELGRTQSGNNNAYCQDNPLTWLDWANADTELSQFTAGLIALRKRFPQLRNTAWLSGRANEYGEHDIVWWHFHGHEMRAADWYFPTQNSLAMLLAAPVASVAKPDRGARLLIALLRGNDDLNFKFPPGRWQQHCNSSADEPFAPQTHERQSVLQASSVYIFSQEFSQERSDAR